MYKNINQDKISNIKIYIPHTGPIDEPLLLQQLCWRGKLLKYTTTVNVTHMRNALSTINILKDFKNN